MLTLDNIKPKNKKKKTDFHVIKIDETRFFNDEKLVKAAGKIFVIYMYDKNERTYCCELTPSYYLIPLYNYSENWLEDDLNDELMNLEHLNDVMYVHCSDIDNGGFEQKAKDCNGYYYATDGRKHKELLENAEEVLRVNRDFC